MTNLKEVTDDTNLRNLRMAVQSSSGYILYDPGIQLILTRAWKMGESDFYMVEMTLSFQLQLKGILLFQSTNYCQFFLDTPSTLALVQAKIDASLDQFNAGKHWKYKGI